VTGAFEVGGIVGGVYCQYAGNVRVGYSAYTGGTLRTTNTSQRAYVGGISGYCKGWIAYSYATNVTFATGNGHYLGGAVGHMEGRSPISSIYNSYANVIDYDNANPTYDMPFIATMDSSNVLPVSSCVWTFLGQFNQPEGTGTTNWGRWSGGTTQLSDPSLLNSTATVAILNTGATNPGFAVGTSTGYPVLAWQTGARQDVYVDPTSPSVPAIPGGTVTYPDTDPAGQIFVNGTAPSGGTGTKTSPFNNILDALSALNASTTQDTIFVTGPLTLNGSITTISSTRTDAVYIKRSSTYDGYLFNLTGGTTAVSNIIIDGNKTAFQTLATPTPTASLFAVNSGATLAIYSGAVLQNNYTGEGGAINVIGGTLNMSGGSIIYNVSEISGGGVVLHRSATFTMSGGSIGGTTTGTGNLAGNNGGGVAVYNDSVFTFSGGTIGNNTAKGEGGGVMVGSGGGHGGTLNMSGGVITENLAVTNGGGVYVDTPAQFMLTGGEISDNTAALGNGIYVTASSTLTLAPSGTNALTFGSGDKIYLPAGITFNIGATLDLANVSTIPLDFADPNTGRLTAIAGSASYAGDSAAKLTYLAGWSFVVNGVDIYLVAPSRV
jgi:hypothetical protein